ncbi:LIC_10190 family membrane protein [Flavobacterium sp. UBA6135]|uniref:LIC_10190 family membrane protein n=1 Tax=Flavobacterium sp. UBA6135 TaxID=1946553 RepID=UPI0025BEB525|nr:hypothetical protein [Flavobacterium sp. UBA6135]
MFLIALSFIYIIFTCINFGLVYSRFIKFHPSDLILNSLLGLFSITIITSIWALFGRIHIEFHLFILFLNCFIFYFYQKEIKANYIEFSKEFKNINRFLKSFLFFSMLLILAQAASIPYVLDNESYYIQTIKWLNNYGFVEGLANLHLFLGQQSGWHITQSAFSFSFLYNEFNDLSAFCLLLGITYSVFRLQDYLTTKDSNQLIFGLLPLFLVLLFQFISAPSPDLPIYILTFFLFYVFLEHYNKMTIGVFNLLTTFVLFMLYIKNTNIGLIILPLLLFLKHSKDFVPQLFRISSIAFLVLALFLLKNIIITGTPVFPLTARLFYSFEHVIPEKIVYAYYMELKTSYGFYVTAEEYKSMNAYQLFVQWLSMPKLNGLFNKISIILLVVCPFLILRMKRLRNYGILYLIMVIHLMILLVTSPQYRFHLNFVLFFSLFCLAIAFHEKIKIIYFGLIASGLVTLLVLIVPLDFNAFSSNKFLLKNSTFNIENIIIPHPKTKLMTEHETYTLGNLTYHSPIKNEFFWASGDGPLPCVNKVQLDYYEYWLHLIPQMQTADLKDGFYAKDISKP